MSLPVACKAIGGDIDVTSQMSALTYSIAPGQSVSTSIEEMALEDESYLFESDTRQDLFGRDEEVSVMKTCFRRVMDRQGAAELVLVSGESGAGKSAIVQALRGFVTSDCNGYFCSGKFDQMLMVGTTSEPFSALAAAFSDIIDLILNDRDRLEERAPRIRQALGSDAATLARFISNLTQLTGISAAESYSSALTQHRILFRTFLNALTSAEHPILLFLDDLQFADEESLEIFRALATDSSLKHTLVVGVYRSDEIARNRLFENDAKGVPLVPLKTTELTVESLDLAAITGYLMNALATDETAVEPLGEAILSKSGGNPLYMTQFLNVLIERKLVRQDAQGRFNWKIEDIVAETNVSDNVLKIVTERLEKLPDPVRAVMIVIAHIGSRFDFELVESVVLKLDTAGEDYQQVVVIMNLLRGDKAPCMLTRAKYASEIKAGLKRAMMDGLIEQTGHDKYKFTHDRLHQCCCEQVSSELGKVQLHYCIGQAGAARVNDGDAALFFVADQQNRGSSLLKDADGIVALAEVNLKAGMAAAAQSAFQAASSYLRAGVNLINEETYRESHHELLLDLLSTSAEIEAKNSRFEISKELCELVLSQSRNLDEQLRVFVCLLEVSNALETSDRAELGLQFLRKLGVKFPKSPNILHIILSIIRTKMLVGGATDEMLINAPVMVDKRKPIVMEILAALASTFYSEGNCGDFYVLLILRMVRETIRFGVCGASATAWSSYAMINSATGERKAAWRYGNVALQLLSRLNDKRAEAKSLGILHQFVLTWERPFSESIIGFQQCVDLNAQLGDSENMYATASGLLATMFHSGAHLYNMLETASDFCQDIKDTSGQSAMAKVIVINLQMLENLTGTSENRVKLTGTVIDEDEMILDAEKNKNLVGLVIIHVNRLVLAVTFNAWFLADEIAVEVMKGIRLLKPHFTSVIYRFYVALTCAQCYHKNIGKKRKNLGRLKTLVRQIEKLVKRGNNNYRPHLLILQAGLSSIHLSIGQDTTAAKASYRLAIEHCRSQHYIQLDAMSNERACEACYRAGDKRAASEFLWEARKLYQEWGADAKVAWIEEQVSMGRLPTPCRHEEHV